MIRPATVSLRGVRTNALVVPITIRGIDLTDALLTAAVLQNWDNDPADPEIEPTVTLEGVEDDGGVPVSSLTFAIPLDDMEAIPTAAELGTDLKWVWMLDVQTDGSDEDTKQRYLEGPFIVGGSASGSGSVGTLVVTVSDQTITVEIDGASALGPLVASATGAAALAREWAQNPEDDAVTGYPGEYSARHYSIKAEETVGGAVDAIEAAIGDQFTVSDGDLFDSSGRQVRWFVGIVDGANRSSPLYLVQIGTDLRPILHSPIFEGNAVDMVRVGEGSFVNALAASPRRVAYAGTLADASQVELLSFEPDGSLFAKPGWRFNKAGEEAPTVLSGTVGNAFEVTRLGDGLRAFWSDIGTKTARYKQKVGGTAVVFDAAYWKITGWSGQSLGMGGATGTPVSTTAPAANHGLMLASATFAYGGNTSVDITAAKSSGTTNDEPPAYGFVAQRHARQVARASRYDVLGVSVGAVSQKTYAELAKGTDLYTTHAAALRRFMEIAREYGAVPLLEMHNTHGENDRVSGTSRATYLANLGTWRTDYQTDWRAWSGDSGFVLPWFQDQLCGQSSTNGPGVISLAQLDFVEAGSAYAVCPKYMLTMTDGIHLAAADSRLLGEYHGHASDVIAASGTWTGVRPNGNPTRAGAVVTQPMFVQSGALAFDTTWLPQRNAAYGFEASKVSDGTALIITNVAISTTNIVVTLSSDPGEAVRLRYAYTPNTAPPNNTNRSCAWGNLRDSDTTLATDGVTFLRNFCWTFQKDTAS